MNAHAYLQNFLGGDVARRPRSHRTKFHSRSNKAERKMLGEHLLGELESALNGGVPLAHSVRASLHMFHRFSFLSVVLPPRMGTICKVGGRDPLETLLRRG